jgi:hypothetical protein
MNGEAPRRCSPFFRGPFGRDFVPDQPILDAKACPGSIPQKRAAGKSDFPEKQETGQGGTR